MDKTLLILSFIALFYQCSHKIALTWEQAVQLQVSDYIGDTHMSYKEAEWQTYQFRSINIEKVKPLLHSCKQTKKKFLWFGAAPAILTMADGKQYHLDIGFGAGLFRVVETGLIYYLPANSQERRLWDELIFSERNIKL